MTFVQPETFTLTDQEAAAIQSVNMARQASIARSSPYLRVGSIAAPFIVAAAIYALDLAWFGGAMPAWLFVTLMAVFVAGMMTQAAAFWASLQVSKRRMREQTRQVFEPRTVRLTDEGLEQATPAIGVVHKWSGVDGIQSKQGLIIAWAGNLLACAIPERAFSTPSDAEAFLAQCRLRAAARSEPRP